MKWFKAFEVANMFQNDTVDDILDGNEYSVGSSVASDVCDLDGRLSDGSSGRSNGDGSDDLVGSSVASDVFGVGGRLSDGSIDRANGDSSDVSVGSLVASDGGGLDDRLSDGSLDRSSSDSSVSDGRIDVQTKSNKRRRLAEPESWKQNINKKLRQEGKEYQGWKYDDAAKSWKMVTRPEKTMKNLCRKESCEKASKRHCLKFSTEECHTIFEAFWGCGDINSQRTFIRAMVDVKSIIILKKWYFFTSIQRKVHLG